jgi:coenzyme F420 hydrogenase subunit beta
VTVKANAGENVTWGNRVKLQIDRDVPWAPPPAEPVSRDLCTDCGISRTSDPKRCGRACQFIKPDYETLEAQVHGRARDPERADERFFGP